MGLDLEDLAPFFERRPARGESILRADLLELPRGREALELVISCALGEVGSPYQQHAARVVIERTLRRDRTRPLCRVASVLYAKRGAVAPVAPLSLVHRRGPTSGS